MEINLDQARAVRRETLGETPVVVFGETQFTLPVEWPVQASITMGRFAKAQAANDQDAATVAMLDTFAALLNGQYEKFMAFQPSWEDLNTLLGGIPQAYGFESPGESQASDDS